jgi:chitinase
MSSSDPGSLPDPPQPQLSVPRVLVAILVLVIATSTGALLLQHSAAGRTARAQAVSRPAPWFAPYVDATLTPLVAFQDRSANPARDVVLGFVVAGSTPAEACSPTWGTYASLQDAATKFDLDRRIAQVRGQGGDAIVSFGGQANSELAVTCHQSTDLAAAYRSVIDRYNSDTVDFDIEGTAVADVAANARRAQAIKTVQDAVRMRKHHLAVWLTLPVTPRGLNPDAVALVRGMVAAKVDVAGINVMAMDFGEAAAGKDMLKAVTSSMTATRSQLAAIFGKRAGWSKLGVTVMVGQNDVDAESLSVADAGKVAVFARSHGMARVSLWSLNRDSECGATFAVLRVHSNYCSGVVQKPRQFSTLFAEALRGSARDKSSSLSTGALPDSSSSTTVDDPAKSPYPIWEPEQAYRVGYKVVWHQAVYVAKWYSQGQTPESPSVTATAAPWRLVGPVLSTDRPPRLKRLAVGTYPAWSSAKVFKASARVLYHRLPYEAAWHTQGDLPGGTGVNGTPSPWKALYTIPGEPRGG